MGEAQCARSNRAEENEEVSMDERLIGKLQSEVEQTRRDVARVEADVREIRGDIKVLTSEVAGLRTEVRTDIEKLRGSQRLGFAVLIILQLLVAAGAPGAIASALKLF